MPSVDKRKLIRRLYLIGCFMQISVNVLSGLAISWLRSFLCFHLYLEVIFNWSFCFHCWAVFSFLFLKSVQFHTPPCLHLSDSFHVNCIFCENVSFPVCCTVPTGSLAPVTSSSLVVTFMPSVLRCYPAGLVPWGAPPPKDVLMHPRITRHTSEASRIHRGRDPSFPGLTYPHFSPCITSFFEVTAMLGWDNAILLLSARSAVTDWCTGVNR